VARKYELIASLYEDAIHEVTANPEHWMAFLHSACRNYRLPFDEQLLIHVQRPDAVAVLEIADWNKKFGRWVKKDSKGIAVFDKNADHMQLKHYFDISDTQESRYANRIRSVPLWEVEERYREDVKETLANAFGVSEDTFEFADTILEAAKNLANDNLPDYLSDILACRNGSFLEELDALNVEVEFRTLLENSIAYMLLTRCGFVTEGIFETEDFRNITDFNTPQLVNILGSATSDIAEMPLIQISDTVKALQKMEQETNRTFAGTQPDRYNEGAITDNHTSEKERSFEHERTDIHETRRLLSAEPDSHTGTGGTSWEVRLSAPEISEGAALRDIHQPTDTGQTEQPPAGDSGDGTKPHGADNEPNGESTGRDGGIKSSRPDEMGGDDEQYPPVSGGSDTERTDLHLIDEKSGEAEELPDFSFDLMESVLCNDQFLKKKQYDVIDYFRYHNDYQERTEFIQNIYNQDFTLFDVDNWRVGYKAQDNGLLMWEGNYLSRKAESVFSWAAIQEMIADMMERGVYGDRHPYNDLPSENQQLSLFDLDTDIQNQEPVKQAGFQISQQVIDEAEQAKQDLELITAEPPMQQDNSDLVGKEITIDNRRYAIERVNSVSDNVSLRDITFQNDIGFPISRVEKINYVKGILSKQIEGYLFENSVVFDNRNAEIVSTLLGIETRQQEYAGGNFITICRVPAENFEEKKKLFSDNGYQVFVYDFDKDKGKFEDILAEKETVDLTPAWEKPKPSSRIQTFDLHPEISLPDRHQYRITNDELGYGTPKEKFKRNMDAINVLQDCESENRYATPSEQEILAKYVGWGGLSNAFDDSKSAWSDEFAELSTTLSPEEYAAARESSLTAFYTPPVVIRAMYQALSNMGLKAGNILEPSCAVGNFLGMLPEQLSDCKIYGVELDSLSGRIAQQLYQTSTIAVQGFEKTTLPDSFFDVAIGNVPFGQFKLSDKRYDKHHFLVHDYFFAKTLDKVRPGGVIAFITSKGTMDKQNPAIRKYIAQRAELLGAIRLPDNTFKANAGTEVTSDILFLQKRDRVIDVEPEWVFLSTDENNISMNSYFVSHSEMVLGEMIMESTQYGMDSTCRAYEDTDLEMLLSEAIQNIHGEIADYEMAELEEETDNTIPADPSVPNFSYALADNQIYYRENSRMKPVELSVTAANRVKGMIEIRDCTRTLIEYQTEDYPDSDIRREQDRLNMLYDAFQKKYGLLNTRANSMVFSDDSSYPLLCSLEIIGEDETQWHKADMFHQRTIKPHTVVTKADTASEALALTLAEKACVDMVYMCSLTGKSAEDIERELSGVIFRLPGPKEELDNPRFVPADEYLSGNVRDKLKQAKMALEVSNLYEPNVEALEKVQPKDLSASEISVRLGATWIPTDDIEDFMFALLGTPNYARWNIKTHFSQYTGEWNIEGKSYDKSNVKAYNTYGTNRINAYKIIEETLNLRDVRIFDYVEDEQGKRKPVLNKKATAIAQGKQELIKQVFQGWIWKDPARRQRLTRDYNEKFNSVRPREYDGSHLNFPGINPLITLRQHQLNGVSRILYGGNSLLAFVVGSGKTFTIVAAAMESKRLGLCHKAMIVVPNHIIEQFAAEWLQLYPAANLLVSTKKDFEMKNRKKFCARIATSDVDAVIIGHSQFERIPISAERQQRMLQQQMHEIVDGIAEAKRNGGDKFTVKQLEKTKKSLQVRLDKLNDQSRKDDVVTFEQLGIDRLFVDEADSYKNLYLYTKMRNVGGIAQTEAQKSSDMFMKCRYLDEITGGRGVVFATGTPVSNSMVELYTMQRYLQYDTLSRNHLQHFDSWASTFGETITAIELAPEGTGYRAKTRFAKFYNLPELLSMFREVADIQTADMLNLPVPKANYRVVSVKPSDMQKDMVADLAKRAERVRNRLVDATEDNMLLITNDGRKLALDQRLMNELLGDEPESKVNACVNEAFRFWQAGMDQKLTQLVFSDLSTPHNDGKFNVYDDVRNKLQAKGVPREEVVFIHEANTEMRKKELFAKVRRGAVRIMIGSTFKMGAGTNIQDLIIASHDLDCPWRPRDLEQRAGRTVRQGNKNEEVDIIRYVTEGTFDAYLYQVIENKQKFISQIMTSKSPARSAEDVDETALSYAEIKALATGNPHIKEKMDLDIQVSKLQLLKQNYLSQKYELEDQLMKHYPLEIKRLTERIAGYQNDIATVKLNTPAERETFPPMQIKGVFYTEKVEAGKAIIAACKEMTSPDAKTVGIYRGLSMELSFQTFSREYVMDLKGTLRHSVPLGSDIHGNIPRLDNVIAGLEDKRAACAEKLENVKQQMETAQIEVKNPFPQEEELATKTERLNELNALLNMDEKDIPLLDGSPDEGNIQQQKETEQER